jgi:hypothetical protein
MSTLAFLNAAPSWETLVEWNKKEGLGVIGPAKAQKIIAQRQKQTGGRFRTLEDVRCTGVHNAVIDALKGRELFLLSLRDKTEVTEEEAKVTEQATAEWPPTRNDDGDCEELPEHWNLGMTVKGMLLVFYRIGVLTWPGAPNLSHSTRSSWPEENRSNRRAVSSLGTAYGGTNFSRDFDPLLQLMYVHENAPPLAYIGRPRWGGNIFDSIGTPVSVDYQRVSSPEHPDYENWKWLYEMYGTLCEGDDVPGHVRCFHNWLGYDLRLYLKQWMKKQRRDEVYKKMSLCELVQQGIHPFEGLEGEVGEANVFCSHLQKRNPWEELGELNDKLFEQTVRNMSGQFVDPTKQGQKCLPAWKLEAMAKDIRLKQGTNFVWMSFTSLRQFGNEHPDFNELRVAALMQRGNIKTFVALFDFRSLKCLDFMHSLWCIYEMYWAFATKMKLIVSCFGLTAVKRALL